jgi:hypothetical protein
MLFWRSSKKRLVRVGFRAPRSSYLLKDAKREIVMGALIYLLRGVLAVLGRIVGQVLGARGDIDNKRRELRVHALVDAWRNLERAVNHPGPDEMRAMEQSLADIQLFGTPVQAEHAARVARSMNEGDADASVDELLEALRVDLRKEMRLGPAQSRLVRLRSEALRAAPPPSARRLSERRGGRRERSVAYLEAVQPHVRPVAELQVHGGPRRVDRVQVTDEGRGRVHVAR